MSEQRVITHATFLDARALDQVVHEMLFDDDRFVVGELLTLRHEAFAIERVDEVLACPGTMIRFVTLRADPAYVETSDPTSNFDHTKES